MTEEYKELNFDVHQLSHTQLFTPVLEDSLEFFCKVLGMTVVHKSEDSYYLRAYEDSYNYSLILTQNDEAGMGFTAFRTSSPQALERTVERIKEYDVEQGWREADENIGYGRSYRFKDLDGHVLEVYWEVDRFYAPEKHTSGLKNRPQRRPLSGVPVRRIDHVNLMTHPDMVTENYEFFRDALGFRLREAVAVGEEEYFATWLSVSPLVHEVALMGDELGGHGRLHHLAYWYGMPQHLNDLADICIEYGIALEAGPLKHGVSQALCMYVIEPGGNRIELFGDSGYLIFEPDWEPAIWSGDETAQAIIWYGGDLPETYFRHGTPRIHDEREELNLYYNPIKNALKNEDFVHEISDEKRREMYKEEH